MISGEPHQYRRLLKVDAILLKLLHPCGATVSSRLLKFILAHFYGIKCQEMSCTTLRKWSRNTTREMYKSATGTPSADFHLHTWGYRLSLSSLLTSYEINQTMLLTHPPRIEPYFHLLFSQLALFFRVCIGKRVFFLSHLLALSSSSSSRRHGGGTKARRNMGWASAYEIVLSREDDGMKSGCGCTHILERNEFYGLRIPMNTTTIYELKISQQTNLRLTADDYGFSLMNWMMLRRNSKELSPWWIL